MGEIENSHYQSFEAIKEVNEHGQEFWMARKLARVLDYADFRNFTAVIDKARKACENSGQDPAQHFEERPETIELGSSAERELPSFALSRYACYLIVQNGDPSKPVIAEGQTYFAIQTRRQELADDATFKALDEDGKRVLLRNELREHNRQLVATAKQAGVESALDFAIFQNHGYKGLYGGLDAQGIHQKKGLKKSQKILDHMGSTELAANLFRATQTEEKLRRDDVHGKREANRTHFEVGKKVRKTIEELGGTMPEDLPAAERSAVALEKEQKKLGGGE